MVRQDMETETNSDRYSNMRDENSGTLNEKSSSKAKLFLRRLRIAMLLILVSCVVAPIAAMNHEPEYMSEADNRTLAEKPRLEEGVDLFEEGIDLYEEDLTAYMSDRIGFRDEMIAAYSLLNDKAFHLMTHPLYEYGDDGYVFFRFQENGYDEELIASFAAYIREMQDYCEERDIPFLYVITPEKWRVYQEKIPDTVGELPSTTVMLKDHLDTSGVNYIDLGDAVIEAKDEGAQVFNPVYDAGHWNSEGMYAGSQAIIDRLQEMGIKVDDIDLDDYDQVYEQKTILPASNYPIDETVFTYEVKEDAARGIFMEEYAEDLEMNESFTTFGYFENEDRREDASLLMFQGSYFNNQGRMLQNQFSRIAQVHDYENVFNLPYYVGVFQPQVVIFENSDYTILNRYYNQELLETVELPPAYTGASFGAVEEMEGGILEYSPKSKIANFEVDLSELAPEAAYALVGDTVYDLTVREDEDGDENPVQGVDKSESAGQGTVFYWGVTTSSLPSVDRVKIIGIADGVAYGYDYQLKAIS